MSFQDVLNKYRAESANEKEKGTRFEELMRRYLLTDLTYSNSLEWVVMWNDFFGREELGGKDTGIDLVAKTKAGEYWAIQCKCYAEETTVNKKHMDSFISTSGRIFHDENGNKCTFSYRLFIASTDSIGSNARNVLEGQAIPALILNLHQLANAAVDWDALDRGLEGKSARSARYQMREHQQAAFLKAMDYFETNDRGKMVMACGTGKTFTSMKIAEGLLGEKMDDGSKSLVLFLAPSISLVGQTLREWSGQIDFEMNAVCVCSDTTVGKKKKTVDDDVGETAEELGVPSTTDPAKILEWSKRGDHTVIFSTYQSIDAVIEAQHLGLPEFDVIVCDEAHRTTGATRDGEDKSNFVKVHSNDEIKGQKRLYMTATPRIYGEKGKSDAEKGSVVLFSMDDEKVYGKEFYSISFGEAVEKDLLTDYKVLILTTSESLIPPAFRSLRGINGKEVDTDDLCKIWGCLNALAKNIADDETLVTTDPGVMKSAVSFCRSITDSNWLSYMFEQIAATEYSPLPLQMKHIDGSMNAFKRDELLTWLKEDSEVCHVLSNVRCLSEGVDVPALDAIMFLSAKNSMVDVVQSVGRVMRKADGKRYGYIIIPIVVPENVDADEALDNNENFKVVWQVLRALRSHDERLEAEINNIAFRDGGNGGHISINPPGDQPGKSLEFPPIPQNLEGFEYKLMAKLVKKVGNREYIENWAKQVADITPALTKKLTEICYSGDYETNQDHPFRKYVRGIQTIVNNNVSEESCIDMLVQQIITKPIFEKLFAKDGFAFRNSVSGYIEKMLEEVHANEGLAEIQDQLDKFYRSVEVTLNGIDTTDGKQKVITALYEKFFKNAFPKDQSINGVVYTPQEIVDFIIHSCVDVLKAEFGVDINDEGVNVLDPFTGTGTFIARLIESGVISKENLGRKYLSELYANEITLLAYYIACVNIENAFQRVSNSTTYLPFDNILLTDTFNIEEICRKFGTGSQTRLTDEYFGKNRQRIRRENDAPITIIMGNPPYGGRQKSANDDAKKRKYKEGIDLRIESTYLSESLTSGKKTNVNSVYDNYIRAFRWATDRIGNNNGIISFVTPNGWLAGSAFEGFRKSLESEFSSIYIFNLRGDQNGSDWKLQGEKVFGGGSKVGIAVTLLVKNVNKTGKATIKYIKSPDCSKRIEKLNSLVESISFLNMSNRGILETLEPKSNGDWIVQRNSKFDSFVPLVGNTHKKFEKHEENTIFTGYTLGYATHRDQWSYNYSKECLTANINKTVSAYNDQVIQGRIVYDPTQIKWCRSLEESHAKKKKITFSVNKLESANYRPFCKMWFYNEAMLIDMSYLMPRLYPRASQVKSPSICLSTIGDKKGFSCLMVDGSSDLHVVGQYLPLYWYSETNDVIDGQMTLCDSNKELIANDGISDFAIHLAKTKYGEPISKEDIFYYTYGYLHSEEYRKAFADDLKLSLPRIDFVKSYDDFKSISDAGRCLSKLHLNYESAPADGTVQIKLRINPANPLLEKELYRVTKMKLDPISRKLVYNEYITIENIPEDAFRYVVNGRTALGWLVDQYQYSVDKDSGIVNDPNEYAGPKYIMGLVLSIITVSVETMKIVDNLPKLNFDDKKEGE